MERHPTTELSQQRSVTTMSLTCNPIHPLTNLLLLEQQETQIDHYYAAKRNPSDLLRLAANDEAPNNWATFTTQDLRDEGILNKRKPSLLVHNLYSNVNRATPYSQLEQVRKSGRPRPPMNITT